MKHLAFFMIIFTSSLVHSEDKTILSDLAQLTWKNRIILVLTNYESAEYLKDFKENEYGINDRDIVWFVLGKEDVATNYHGKLSKYFSRKIKERFSTGSDSVLLIGKDGGVKDRRERLQIDTLFKKIDSMPMRKIEMERNAKENP